ncbi:Wzt carbohydrate-binding domain-containing protein [Burkholderia lata]|uniref:Wzt carbohydrate-binding domain-containing protein n=1 Tax=Burkholderia lata (strain ATCC 17760 / DSM 23089 / LMG 22485 / NCIMB 9086 / R18194 / 383) TaxID=482957 RepID=UPI0015814B3D|nr:Wzt carbohydrate-binding domain-containing protein [Burkholderia lata]
MRLRIHLINQDSSSKLDKRMIINRPRGFSGRVIFDHLPKTAGQAINAWLVSTLGSGCAATSLNAGHRELIKQLGGEYSLISAHMSFQGEGFDPRYEYVTFLREPIDRAISWLFFVHQNHDATDLAALWHQAKEFIDSDGESSVSLLGQIVNPYIEHFCSIDPTPTFTDAERLAKALAILGNYDLWGIYESMPDFLGDFAALLGAPAPREIAKVNVTLTRPSSTRASAQLRRRLEELNALDLEFYEIVRDRYAQERRRWQRPAVQVPAWTPIERLVATNFNESRFSLISATVDGERNCKSGSILSFLVEFSISKDVPDLEIGIHIFDSARRWAFGTNTTMLENKIVSVTPGIYQFRCACVANLPEGEYTAGFAFAEQIAGEMRNLAWYDELVTFHVTHERLTPSVGYAELTTVMDCYRISESIAMPVIDGTGTLQSTSDRQEVKVNETYSLLVTLSNNSNQDWINLHSNPISLSYRWLDENGEFVVVDGQRTPLPGGQLLRGKSVTVTMAIEAPKLPGRYELQAQPVQEMVCWFDECGFTPLRLFTNVQGIKGRSHPCENTDSNHRNQPV